MNETHKAGFCDIDRLVQSCQAGDKDAFGQLVRLHQRPAMQMAVRLLADVTEASEAVQAGFIKAYLNISKLNQPGRFGIWLLRIVANEAISQRRAAKRRMQIIKTADCHRVKKVPSPVQNSITEELKEAIQRAMFELSGKQAKAISLFGLEDLSHSQVAEIMGCSTEAARWHVFKARQKLKVLLKEYL